MAHASSSKFLFRVILGFVQFENIPQYLLLILGLCGLSLSSLGSQSGLERHRHGTEKVKDELLPL